MRLAEFAFSLGRTVRIFGNTFRRKASGLVFSALDFVSVALIVNAFLCGRTADGLGPGLSRVTVVMLVMLLMAVAVAMAQATAGAETHAAPATPGKVSFTHN